LTRFLLIALCFFAGGATLSAGEITLENGDTLTGKVAKLEKGELAFETPFGTVVVPVEKIASLEMEEGLLVKVGDAAPKAGAIDTDEKGVFAWGDEEARLGDIVSIRPAPKKITEFMRWSGSLDASVTWTDGNTHTLVYHAGLSVTRDQTGAREPFQNRFGLALAYDYGKSDGEQNKRRGSGLAKEALFFHPRLAAYLEGSWIYDFEAGIERKNTLGAGLSWNAVKEEGVRLDVELGVSYVGTFYNDHAIRAARAAGQTPVTFEEYPAGRAMAEFDLALPLGFAFHHKTVVFVSLEDAGKHTLHSETSVARALTGGWFLKLTVRYDYVEPPAFGKKRGDATYLLSVVFKF